MSDFWDKNKGSIKSGLATAGKYSYQGTKYVAKTGYQAGKSQYQTNKKNRKNGGAKGKGNDDDEEPERGEPAPINRLNDPKNFPAPPLRQGQNQYAGNGQYVSANDAPISNTPTATQTPNQQMNQYQNQSQQGYFDQQYSNSGTPATAGYPQQQPMQQQQQQGYQQPVQQHPIQLTEQGYQQPMQQHPQQQQSIQQGSPQPVQQRPIQLTEQGYQQPQQQPIQQQQGYQQPIQQSVQQPIQQPIQQQSVQQPIQQQQGYPQPVQQQPIQLTEQGYQQPQQQQGYQQSVQQPIQQGYPQPVQQQPIQQQQGYQQSVQQPIQQGYPQPVQQQPIQLTEQGYQQPQQQQGYQQPDQQQPQHQPIQHQPRLQPAIPGRAQPQIPFKPEIPSRTQTNIPENTMNPASSEQSPVPSSVGPHFEVKPFNKEEYEEAKKQKATILPVIDPSTIAPPPTHRDRSNEASKSSSPQINPLYPSNSSNSSVSKRAVPVSLGKAPSYSDDTANKDAYSAVGGDEDLVQEEQSETTEEATESSINGSYQEPTTSFAPPPKPHRNVETNKNAPRKNSYAHNSAIGSNISLPSRGNQPPPVLPKRGTSDSLGQSGSTVELGQISTMPDQINDNTSEKESIKTISGAYTAHTVDFQPPPKPFRRPGEGSEDRNLSKKVTSTSFSSHSVPGLPTRRHTTDYPSQYSTESKDIPTSINDEQLAPPSLPSSQPIAEFPPPPKPFKLKTENLPSELKENTQNNELFELKGQSRADGVVLNDELPQQRLPNSDGSTYFDDSRSKGAMRPKNYESSQSIDSSNQSVPGTTDFFQDLNASISALSLQGSRKNKAAPPPVVKPKPKALSHISLDNKSNTLGSNDISVKGKKPPPVIKPKPKSFNNIFNGHGGSSSVPINKPKIEAPIKSPGKLPSQPPSRGSSRGQIPTNRTKPAVPPPHGDIQIPTNRRSKMPLPHDINKNKDSEGCDNEEDDVNPFLIYKKDAVPSSNDRMHDNN
ncbi:hypothetical protein MOSE0_M03884 [Monosporozyma servazzii]